MSVTFPDAWRDRCRRTGVVAVVTLDDPERAEPLAEALLEEGIDLLELTLRTPAALQAMLRIAQAFPEMGLGAGTVLNPAQIPQVMEAGAEFGVAPGLNPAVVIAAQRAGLPFAPGVCTPSEVEQALELGCHVLKFFPAEPLGGARLLRMVATPYAHLGVEFLPLGGLTQTTAESYLREPHVLALGGSWIAPRELIAAANWPQIRLHARAIRALVQSVRGTSPAP
jgi:2-dehydro-3-deoxyphosphogluconate aldolase/(4S)-4-hydroxy-2-oxoglutarate aldolase